MNYYEILAVAQDADKPQIKRAYFSMVKRHSPDKDPEGFKAVRLAYETLYDDKKRAEYDTYFNAGGDRQNEFLAAQALFRQNKYKEAVEFLAALIGARPSDANADIMRLYAKALWRCRKSGKAEDICKALLKKNPQDVDTLLLRADIAASRGHTNKACDYYNSAVDLEPNRPKTWIQYMHYLLAHQPWRVTVECLRAMGINPYMFRDDYELYLRCVCSRTEQVFSLFGERDSGDESSVESRMLSQCFGLFTECFIADPRPSRACYQNTLNALPFVIKKPFCHPHIEKLLPVLEQCGHRDKEDDNKLNVLRAAMVVRVLYADERIHDVLADLTGYLLAGKNDQAERMFMECFIIKELPGIRKSIKTLRDVYPEYFKLNRTFYLDALNVRKTEYLNDKYYALYKRLLSDEDVFDDDDFDDDRADDEDGSSADGSPEAESPYVREAPKVGRNEPCPCGSGKKYKRCCGASV